MKALIFFLFLLMTCWIGLLAQGIEGTVTDMEGIPLPYASIYIEDLRKGTAANEDGAYRLPLPSGNYRITFQYLGFSAQTQEVRIRNQFVEIDVQMNSEPIELSEVTVAGDREDPAYTIMRKAIAKAKYHSQQIDEYTAKSYIKGAGRLKGVPGLFRKRIEKELKKEGIDSTTAFVTESVSEIHYKRPNQFKEKVISIRTIGDDNNTSPASFISSSFYEAEVSGAVSPLSPRAFAYYRFEFLGEISDRGHLINKIKVTPRSRGDNLFEGVIYIVDQVWSIHSLDLFTYVWGIKFQINQIYAPIVAKAWLPVNNIFDVTGSVFGFKFEYQYFANISDYNITLNPELDFQPEIIDDKLFKEEAKAADAKLEKSAESSALEKLSSGQELSRKELRKLLNEYEKQEQKEFEQDTMKGVYSVTSFKIDSNAQIKDSLFWDSIRPIPLTMYEVKGYRVMDSIAIAEVQEEAEEAGDTLSLNASGEANFSTRSKSDFEIQDLLFGANYKLGESTRLELQGPLGAMQFNTVDGFHSEYGLRFYGNRDRKLRWSTNPKVRYAFARKKVSYRLLNSLRFGKRDRSWRIRMDGGKHVFQLNPDNPIEPAVNTFWSLLFEQNYMKVFEKDFGLTHLTKELSDKVKLDLGFEYGRHTPLRNHSDYVVFDNNKRNYTSNIPYNIELGDTEFSRYNSFTFSAGLELEPWTRYRIRNGRRIKIANTSPVIRLNYRQAIPDLFSSETEFNNLELSYRHDIKFAAGTVINLKILGGVHPGNDVMFFPDYKHFAGNKLPFAMADPVGSFRLLDYYTFSTQRSYLNAHVHYQFRKFLVTQSPFARLAGIRESLFVNALETRHADHYMELGYGLNYIFRVFRIEAVTSFQDFKFQDWGIRIGLAANLETLFGDD